MTRYFLAILSALACLFFSGCLSTVIEKFSYPVSQGYPDYGSVPSQLPRYVKVGAPGWTGLMGNDVRDLRQFGIFAMVTMSNEIFTQDGRYTTKPLFDEPLVIKINIWAIVSASGEGSVFTLSDAVGKLTLASGESIDATEMYLDVNTRSCGISEKTSESSRYYLNGKKVYFDFFMGKNVKEPDGRLVTSKGCMVFEYPEPVSVDNVFTVDFAKITMADGRVIPFKMQFYPLVRESHSK